MQTARGLGVLAALLAGACQTPSAPATTRPAPPLETFTLADLVGTWRWELTTTEAGTTRVERELWRFQPGPSPTQLVGRYTRDVDVTADDGQPFQCDQRPRYRQRAVFDVGVELASHAFAITESDYRTEPSPCDHGFRHLGTYTATLSGTHRLTLAFEGGTQTLIRVDDASDLPPDPWAETPSLDGSWRWHATSYNTDGTVSDETEWWELVRRSDTRLDATYRRRVTVRSPDGKPLACANAPSWTFDDAYLLDGQREDEHWHLYERAVDPGDHPCLRVTPRRVLDEATAEQIGDYLILEWRGKRRQVLYRPEP
jgi:hypothetical protein